MESTKNVPIENRIQPTVKLVTVVETAPAPTNRPASRVTAALVALVLLGGGARTASFLTDRNLWIDEAMLALNLVDRSPAQLFDKLDYNQGAPVAFLLVAKAGISAFGPSAWALRLVPFIASIVGLIAFSVVSRRLLSPGAAVFATALFALSPHIVSYAGECKQYQSDATLAIGLFAVSLGLLEGKGGFWRWFALAVSGAAAVWCSHPSVFVLGGIGTALLVWAAVERDRARFLSASATVGAWLVSFGICYVLCLKQLGGNKYLTDYWAGHFMSFPPKGLGDVAWLVDHVVAFFVVPGGFGGLMVPLGGFAAVLALVGVREFARERWPLAVALVMPTVLVLFASSLHKYPIGGRLMLFMVPIGGLLVARGAWAVFDAMKDKNRFAAVALLGLLVGASAWQTWEVLQRPLRHEQLAPVLDRVRSEFQPGDRLYVYYGAGPAFTFYTRTQSFPADVVVMGEEHRDDPAGYLAELKNLHGRVWVVFSHPHNYEETIIRTALDCRGPCEREVKKPGAGAFLYRLE
ncbi:glycosyltransferase family 39 protein [Gemmata sp. SH-PL17]|uniref:glycosyltransferase family 39 protein n=1 Tax=Gemmata sp. SH-PL17 TaxID=1630693 RepID=UPI0004B9FF1A|nr:glycosyltransferase family 39 protein [Gemmata sp. SH-PL17]